MAQQRARNYDDSSLRFGRGGSREEGSKVEHLGVKDPRQARAKQLPIRLTAIEDEAIRLAHQEAAGGSFNAFLVGLLMDGLESRRAGVAMIGDGSAAALAEVESLGERMDHGLGEALELLQGFGRVGIANSRHIKGLSEAVEGMAASVEGMSARIESALSRLGAERTEPTGGHRPGQAVGRRVD